ncbi:DUF3592 domain-containing protein [Sinorhizobium garamanticum]|uniref:DUF3592 domain-containing protein n=1 Tax=Sinorhizobium garamanticum TaxID=680247 RepID=A0ABY8DFS2_9HYPH|nr:DUF3592 domain-containing protein [Sinorhizobium garamanticum]WEX87778.1 DUF3592 domain-containing protein [Sinorhizobium garamanticum]
MLQLLNALYAWFAEDFRFVRVLFLMVGVGLTLDTARRLQRDSQLRRFGTSTKGRIVRVSRGEDYDTAIIGFTDAAGRTHEFDSELSHSGAPIGASVDVRYDPQNPRRAHLAERPLSRALLYLVSLIVAAGFIFFSVVFHG